MSFFERANQSLRLDLKEYVDIVQAILVALPKAKQLCDSVVKEARLAHALVAFADSRHTADMEQIVFRLTNLWPYRERAYARTAGFSDEIAEAGQRRGEALDALQLAAHIPNKQLSQEIAICFNNIVKYLDEENALLCSCHEMLQPHVAGIELTRKRIELLTAMVDARVSTSAHQEAMLMAYREAGTLLADWENGVPLEDRGADILQRCLAILGEVELPPSDIASLYTSTVVEV